MFELFSTLTVLESVITEKKLFGMSKLDCSYLSIHIALAFWKLVYNLNKRHIVSVAYILGWCLILFCSQVWHIFKGGV